MNLQYTLIKRIVMLSVLTLSLTLTSQAEAGFVSFSVSPSATSVVLTAPGGPTGPSNPEVTVTFTAQGPFTSLETPATVLLGTFTRSTFTNGSGLGTDDFDLTIQQTNPSSGNDVFEGVLNAVFHHPSNANPVGPDRVGISFNEIEFMIGTVTYKLMTDVAGSTPWIQNQIYDIGTSGLNVYASITGGDPTGGGNQDPILAPEPGSMLLFGMGVVGLIGYGYRNRRRNESV